MATRLPPRYVDVAKAMTNRGAVNVMGIVVDVMGNPMKSQGTSVCMTFTIKDSDLEGNTWEGLKVRYFSATETRLPLPHVGDAVLLRNLYVKFVEGKPTGSAAENKVVPWAIFRPDRDPTSHVGPITGPVPFEPNYQEKAYASALLDACPTSLPTTTVVRQSTTQVFASKPTSANQQKFALLKDVRDRQFVDLIGEIAKIHGNDSEKLTVYLTDYTENEQLFSYESDNGNDTDQGREGDPYSYIKRPKKKWNGPSGRMTIQVTLWEPHATHLRVNFNVNELIRLKNVRIKGSRVEEGSLEGVIHTNRDNPNSTNTFPVDHKDPRVKELLSRKESYWQAHPKKQKRNPDDDPEPLSKKSKNKQKRSKLQPKKDTDQTTLSLKKRTPVNENVKIRAPATVLPQTLEEIIHNESHNNRSPHGIEYRLPFQNLCYLSTVRVVDFYPPSLQDFAVQQEHRSVAYNRNRDPDAEQSYKKWEWRFCLLVESSSPPPAGEPKERMKLFVCDSEAQHLLNMNAADLRQHPDHLEGLREKLFLLWGELEERKRAGIEEGKERLDLPPSLPFNCCIMEYGVQCSHPRKLGDAGDGKGSRSCADRDCFGWERRFGLLKTTIHDKEL
ncbi:telomere-binding alpha subunit central domain protein [Aspergillus stella-maris]|uniref:telomere-binding alpha subunit central domain protein n=1 Tax=Aspergillus stella-maris TaxID=1810926 RepID=UPI003CCE3167